jgi:hypothetical protein
MPAKFKKSERCPVFGKYYSTQPLTLSKNNLPKIVRKKWAGGK